MMQVRDLSPGTNPVPVEVEAASAFEFLMSLIVFADPEEFEGAGSIWAQQVRDRISAWLAEEIEGFGAFQLDAWGKNLMGLALDSPEPRDVPSLLETVEAMPAEAVLLQLLGHEAVRDQEAVADMERALAGDEDARGRVIAQVCADDPLVRSQMSALLELGPEAVKERFSALLRRWYEDVFGKQEAETLEVLSRDAEGKRELRRQVDAGRLVEMATGGVRYVPEVGIERVLLVPSLVARPWVILSEHRGTKVISYPVADASLLADQSAPPEHLVRLYKALGDESRLRILKLLAEGERQLTDIAEEIGVAKSTAHHHLLALRVAGLVRVTTGSEKSYALRDDVIPEVSGLLAGYLGA